MATTYKTLRCGNGTWSVVDGATQRPITFKGWLQIALTEDAAQAAFTILERVQQERELQAQDGRQM